MKLESRRMLPALLALLAVASAYPLAAAPQAPTPRLDLEPALLGGAETLLAFAADDVSGSTRIWAAVPAHGEPLLIGPEGGGSDAAPAAARLADGAPLVLAARAGHAGSRIWSRVRQPDGWGPIIELPSPHAYNRHPTVASGGGRTWAAWLAHDPSGGVRLLTSEWRRRGWSPAESVDTGALRPGRPALAVGSDGRPRVAFSAHDGSDAEIWLARRTAHRWRAPQPVTDDSRHDLDPDLEFDGDQLVVVWSRLDRDGFRPWATILRGPRHRRGQATPLGTGAGATPRLVAQESGLVAIWAVPASDDPATTVLMAAPRQGAGFGGAASVVRARNARAGFAAGVRDWMIGWHGDAGLAAARVRDTATGPQLEPVHGFTGAIAEPVTLTLPGSYLAFGDSITAGLVRFDGVISFVDGYSVTLGRLISELTGEVVTVDQFAVPGELASEGFNRLRAIVLRNERQVVFVMEGANDLANDVEPVVVRDTLMAMVQAVRDMNALPVLATVTPRDEDGWGGSINLAIEATNELLRESAPGVALLVDVWAAFHMRSDLYSDHIHPDAEGYEFMGGVFYRAVQPLLADLLRNGDITRALEEDDALQRQRPRPGSSTH